MSRVFWLLVGVICPPNVLEKFKLSVPPSLFASHSQVRVCHPQHPQAHPVALPLWIHQPDTRLV